MTTREMFEVSLHKANQILKVIGLQTEDEESNQSITERVRNRKFFCFFNFMLYTELAGELAWFVEKGILGSTFIQATYTLPCATLCILGSIKAYYRIKYGHHINDLIHSIRKLQSVESEFGIQTDPKAYDAIRVIVKNLNMAIKALLIFNTCGLVAFLLGPLVIMGFIYRATGVMQLRFPFLILYPFNAFDMRFYPFVYVHQMVGGVFAVFTIFGPDCLYYLFCTFVQVQFCALQYEMERIITPNANLILRSERDAYREKFAAYVTRHRELIRCVNLIEVTYCKSASFNFFSSSLLICLAGFNIVAYEDLAMLSNFLSFLVMCLFQIYLICYYGDNVSRSSTALSQAIYNSRWYSVDAKTAKDLLMVLTRAQKPCKLTAYSFTEINLTAFTRILSTSWSYFALLQSLYTSK